MNFDIDTKAFSELMAGVQSIAVTIAVLVGGLWSAFTFRTLAVRRRARAEVEEAERRLEQQAVLNVVLEVAQLILPASRDLCLQIDVMFENKGNRNVLLHLAENAVLVAECVPFESSVAAVGTYFVPHDVYWKNGTDDYSRVVIRAGASWHCTTVATVRRAGLYQVIVQAELSATEVAVAEKAGLTTAAPPLVWDDRTFITVRNVDESGASLIPTRLVSRSLLPLVETLQAKLAEAYAALHRLPSEKRPVDAIAALAALAQLRADLLYGETMSDVAFHEHITAWRRDVEAHLSPQALELVSYRSIISAHDQTGTPSAAA